MLQGSLKHYSPLMRMLVLLLSSLLGMMIVSLTMMLLVQTLPGFDISSLENLEQHYGFLKLMQALQTVIVFIVPAFIGFILFYDKTEYHFPGKRPLTLVFILIAISIMIFSQSFISWTAWLNQQVNFSEGWKWLGDWIMQSENQAKEMTEVMLKSTGFTDTLVTVVIIAVLPAFGEEIFFRGILQREFKRLFNNAHLAIFITALLFSAFHMQFLTFLPRLVLGIILGYLLLYSENLWVPIAAHFVNNFMAVMLYLHYSKDKIDESILDTQDGNVSWIHAAISFIIIISLILASRKIYKLNTNIE